MKKLFTIIALFIYVLGFSQIGTWYLEAIDGEPIQFNEEIPKIEGQFSYGPEWEFLFETQICGYLKVEFMFYMCECEYFSVSEIIEHIEQDCENPENTQLQNDYFSYFLDQYEYEYAIFNYFYFETLSDGTERMVIDNNATNRYLSFINKDLSTSDLQLSSVNLYPNPVRNELFFTQKIRELEVYNLVGKKVISAKDTKILDFSVLPKGTYIIKAVLYDNSNRTFKILKN